MPTILDSLNDSVLTWYTANLRIASEANGAVADRLVVVDKALGVGATLREVVARIHAGSSSAFLVKIMMRMGAMVVLVERMAMLK